MVVAAGVALPARADTRGELQDARNRLEQAEGELRRLTTEWQRTEASLARAEDAERRAQLRIDALEERLREATKQLGRRAREMFMNGASPTVAALLTSGSIGEVADRWEFASSIAQGDQDLATEVSVKTELLRRERADLQRAIEQQAAAVRALERQKGELEGRIAELAELERELERKIAAQQAAAAAAGSGDPGVEFDPGPIGTGAIQTCPVAGPNSFVDSFGDPRPGGRSHEGIDLIAARGTPVVAVHSGSVHRTSSSIGGLGIVVFHDGSADWTFYTHFDSYGAYGEGSHVGAGDVIGYVGNTGTTVYHLHFEYHPGGGAAINPYSMLLSVC